jgi:hypothetical protein
MIGREKRMLLRHSLEQGVSSARWLAVPRVHDGLPHRRCDLHRCGGPHHPPQAGAGRGCAGSRDRCVAAGGDLDDRPDGRRIDAEQQDRRDHRARAGYACSCVTAFGERSCPVHHAAGHESHGFGCISIQGERALRSQRTRLHLFDQHPVLHRRLLLPDVRACMLNSVSGTSAHGHRPSTDDPRT